MIKLFNSMSREKETFKPIVPNQVRMYVCGVTVYDHSHIGHARSAVVFDMISRYFRFRGFRVNFVKNFTDIDDKIIKQSHDENIPWEELTQKYIDEYHHDMGLLKVLIPSHEPKATEYIGAMIELIGKLMDKGFAYEADGDIYYRVQMFGNYGMLSKRELSIVMARERIESNILKDNPLDFVLWKSSKPGEPWWDSPWGKGRPGWHIECSAMAMKLLGETIDIHGGGEDLLFPHHENEIAQSEASSGKKFANYWMHNGFVTVNQEKMSKSLGNFFTIKEIFAKYGYSPEVMGETLRYFLLSTHYRQPIQFSDQAIDEAKSGLDRFYDLLKKCEEESGKENSKKERLNKITATFLKKFEESMDDDFNTPEAIATLHTFRSELNKLFQTSIPAEYGSAILNAFKVLGEPLGLFSVPPKEWQFGLRPKKDNYVFYQSPLSEPVLVPLSEEKIESLIKQRIEAKNKKDFEKADEIRDHLKSNGIILEDSPNGKTRWKR